MKSAPDIILCMSVLVTLNLLHFHYFTCEKSFYSYDLCEYIRSLFSPNVKNVTNFDEFCIVCKGFCNFYSIEVLFTDL